MTVTKHGVTSAQKEVNNVCSQTRGSASHVCSCNQVETFRDPYRPYSTFVVLTKQIFDEPSHIREWSVLHATIIKSCRHPSSSHGLLHSQVVSVAASPPDAAADFSSHARSFKTPTSQSPISSTTGSHACMLRRMTYMPLY